MEEDGLAFDQGAWVALLVVSQAAGGCKVRTAKLIDKPHDSDSVTLTASQWARIELRWKRKLIAEKAYQARLMLLEGHRGPFEMVRASQSAICDECGLSYGEHPDHPWAPSVHVVCSGAVVKL